MCVQATVTCHADLRELIKETQGTHPLPDGAQWMACTEESKHFVWAQSQTGYASNVSD